MPRTTTTASLVLGFGLACGCTQSRGEAATLASEGDRIAAISVDEAISKYEQALALDPANHQVLWKLARAYRRKEDWVRDAEACARAEKIAPTFATYFFEHGYAIEMQAQRPGSAASWSEAEGLLKEAVARDPSFAQAYEEIAEVDYHLGREQDALANYSKAIETNPSELAFYPTYADLLLRLGHADEAEQVLRVALARSTKCEKNLFAVHSLLGSIDEAKGDVAGATREYEDAKRCR
jgi:tetratricopeptide (TPR) repeat protein